MWFLHSQKFTAVGFRLVAIFKTMKNMHFKKITSKKTVSVAFRYLNIWMLEFWVIHVQKQKITKQKQIIKYTDMNKH